MKNNKSKKKKANIPLLFSLTLTICIIYSIISIITLIPYAFKFFNNYYIIEPGDLPTYSDVFNSLFVVLNIIITTVLNYMLYRLYKNQDNAAYNKDVAGSAVLLYYTLKFNIMRSTSYFLEKNIDVLREEYYIRQEGNVKASSIKYIKTTKCPILEYTKEVKNHIPSVIGHIEDEDIRNKLFIICEDLSVQYKNSGNIEDKLLFVLKDELVKDYKLIEEGSRKWVYVISNMYKNNWENLNDDYRKLMEILFELSKTKK